MKSISKHFCKNNSKLATAKELTEQIIEQAKDSDFSIEITNYLPLSYFNREDYSWFISSGNFLPKTIPKVKIFWNLYLNRFNIFYSFVNQG